MLKPFHYVYKNGKKYVYIGKYFYRVVKEGRRVKWVYVGKEPPEGVPPPPPNPFEGARFRKVGSKYLLEPKK